MARGILSPVTAHAVPKMARRGRRPQHTFQIRMRPYAIQPFMIAPVLPGDTLKNLLLQSRCVTQPIKNPLIGWHLEHYFFYVPFRSLHGVDITADEATAMMLDPSVTLAGATLSAAEELRDYGYDGGVAWVRECLATVVQEFFRDEGEFWDNPTADGVPTAQLTNTGALQSAMTVAQYNAEVGSTIDPVVADGSDAGTDLNASEVHQALQTWQLLKDMNLTDMTYEDYLRTQGVSVPDKEDQFLPELIRYVRNWQYPSNTVDPATGTPSSAVSWSVTERADKDRFFREPGFIFGVTCSRPKIYMSKQTGAMASMLNRMFDFLPTAISDDITATLKFMDNAVAGPLASQTTDYYIDVKDLYLYGDQFVNFALTETNAGFVAVPTAGLVKKYPDATSVDGLFVSGGAGGGVRQDGVVSLNIMSRVFDTTAKT